MYNVCIIQRVQYARSIPSSCYSDALRSDTKHQHRNNASASATETDEASDGDDAASMQYTMNATFKANQQQRFSSVYKFFQNDQPDRYVLHSYDGVAFT